MSHVASFIRRQFRNDYKVILRRMIPPELLDALRQRKHKVYGSWQEALGNSHSYERQLVNKFRIDRHLLSLNAPAPDPDLLTFVLAALNLPTAEIVDFGGATGAKGTYVLSRFPRVKYTVVENPTMVALAKARLESPVCFTTEMPQTCDIFFTSGTLQFCENYDGIISAAFRSARYACIFVRNSFCDELIIRRQRSRLFENGSGPIPNGYSDCPIWFTHRTVQECDLLRKASSSGYELAYRGPDDREDGVLPYRRMVYAASLVFLKSRDLPS